MIKEIVCRVRVALRLTLSTVPTLLYFGIHSWIFMDKIRPSSVQQCVIKKNAHAAFFIFYFPHPHFLPLLFTIPHGLSSCPPCRGRQCCCLVRTTAVLPIHNRAK